MILNNMKDLKLSTFKNMYEELENPKIMRNIEGKVGVLLINGS
jgi:hypothetical protein